MQNVFRSRVARSIVLTLQRELRIVPRNICLITGAPRSGTTAVCEWLGRQPSVLAFQESRILVSMHRFMEEVYRFQSLNRETAVIISLARRLVCDYYLNSNSLLGKKLLVDKEPLEPIAFPARDYLKFIVNYRKIFPHSKLVFVIRDPIATIWSMSARTWGESLAKQETKEFTLEEYAENWCSCVDILLSYKSDPNTYILQYGHLLQGPENESRRIYDFLRIKYGGSFQPRQTKEINFDSYEREKILRLVQPQLEQLSAQGILSLS